jgi:hypothetical protein
MSSFQVHLITTNHLPEIKKLMFDHFSKSFKDYQSYEEQSQGLLA